MDDGALLQVRDFFCGYGRTEVVYDANFTVQSGEFVAVVGPNGAGKSTLLKGVIGVAHQFRGSVEFDGAVLTHRTPESLVRQGLVMIPQGHRVFPRLSVHENLEIGGSTLPRSEVDGAAARAYELFPQLGDRRQQEAGTLSGGEMQMLSIGRALMTDPKVIIFDEPSIGLAPMLVDQVFELIEKLRSVGKAVIMVEQKARRALAIADTGIAIRLGRIVEHHPAEWFLADGRLEEVYLGGDGR